MNNLQTLREFFHLSAQTVAEQLDLTKDDLLAIEAGTTTPAPLIWQRFAEYYADKFHVAGLPGNLEPIHFRLSVDYLMNIGLTMNDLLAFKWYFDNTRPELGDFSIARYQTDGPVMEQRTSNLADILEDYAGYILLNHDGSMNQFIDERHDNHISDWRLILYKNNRRIIDVTPELIYFDYLVNYTFI
jgi:DNA-binding XRE family transcriptional regulator